jgi:hypothetical protein
VAAKRLLAMVEHWKLEASGMMKNPHLGRCARKTAKQMQMAFIFIQR